MASFDKAVLPGGEGKITVKINTRGYRGTRTWSVDVYTNDPNAQKTYLKIKANVKVPVYLSSYRVDLRAVEGQTATKEILVRGELPAPLKIEPGVSTIDEIVKYTIEEVEKGRLFKIRFSNLPGPPNHVRGHLQIKTNYPEKPLVSIRVAIRIYKKSQ